MSLKLVEINKLDARDATINPITLRAKRLYRTGNRCLICTACTTDGVYLRDTIDYMLSSGATYGDLADFLSRTYDIKIPATTFTNHVKNHSPFIKRIDHGIVKVGQSVIRNVTALAPAKKEEVMEAMENEDSTRALQYIISEGMGRIASGEEKITARTTLDAIKEFNKMETAGKVEELAKRAESLRFQKSKAIEGEISDG